MKLRASCSGATVSWLGLVLAFAGCGFRVLTPQLHPSDAVPQSGKQRPVLKVHMKSGELYTLVNWHAAPDGSRVEGTGTRYSIARVAQETRSVSIATSDVALFETNTSQNVSPGGAIVLTIWSTLTGGVAAYCLADPKACFGSCPTFYLDGADPLGRPAAEGFSSSIARALEARDVDAIGGFPAKGGRFAVTMRNEALETHAVRRVRLLVAERPPGGRVLAGPSGSFYRTSEPHAPLSCRAAEGDCLAAVAAADGVERSSPADSHDLATRETVELDFAPTGAGADPTPGVGRLGLVVGARQTLLSTHLFYQTMAYFGTRAGEYLASLERGGPAVAARAMGMARLLGGIDVEVAEGGSAFRRDRQLRRGRADRRGRRGCCRSTRAAARCASGSARRTATGGSTRWRSCGSPSPVVPRALEPSAVTRGVAGRRARAGAAAARRAGHLVTVPGDAYRIAFELPPSRDGLELFLESEGYYYEWMREAWLAEEDAAMAALVLSDPAAALRRMAGPFKEREAGMEQAFWSSRFRR